MFRSTLSTICRTRRVGMIWIAQILEFFAFRHTVIHRLLALLVVWPKQDALLAEAEEAFIEEWHMGNFLERGTDAGAYRCAAEHKAVTLAQDQLSERCRINDILNPPPR